MSTLTWPAWDVEDFEMHLKGNFIEYANPTSKDVAVVDQLGEYWAGSLSLPRSTSDAQGSAQEAFFDKLLGRVNRVALWNLKRPVPRGTARGTMVLGANAAMFASALAISGTGAYATLLQGDMLGAGGQLFRVQDDAVADASGHITVNLGPRLRSALTAGASVAWYRPTVTVLLMADDLATLWRGAGFEPIARIPFVEA